MHLIKWKSEIDFKLHYQINWVNARQRAQVDLQQTPFITNENCLVKNLSYEQSCKKELKLFFFSLQQIES